MWNSQINLTDSDLTTIAYSGVSGSCFYRLNDEWNTTQDFKVVSSVPDQDPETGIVDFALQVRSLWAYANNPPRCSDSVGVPFNIAHHVVLCDPNFPVKYSWERSSHVMLMQNTWAPSDSNMNRYWFPVRSALLENLYEGNEAKIGPWQGCRQLTMKEARLRYPDKYRNIISMK